MKITTYISTLLRALSRTPLRRISKVLKYVYDFEKSNQAIGAQQSLSIHMSSQLSHVTVIELYSHSSAERIINSLRRLSRFIRTPQDRDRYLFGKEFDDLRRRLRHYIAGALYSNLLGFKPSIVRSDYFESVTASVESEDISSFRIAYRFHPTKRLQEQLQCYNRRAAFRMEMVVSSVWWFFLVRRWQFRRLYVVNPEKAYEALWDRVASEATGYVSRAVPGLFSKMDGRLPSMFIFDEERPVRSEYPVDKSDAGGMVQRIANVPDLPFRDRFNKYFKEEGDAVVLTLKRELYDGDRVQVLLFRKPITGIPETSILWSHFLTCRLSATQRRLWDVLRNIAYETAAGRGTRYRWLRAQTKALRTVFAEFEIGGMSVRSTIGACKRYENEYYDVVPVNIGSGEVRWDTVDLATFTSANLRNLSEKLESQVPKVRQDLDWLGNQITTASNRRLQVAIVLLALVTLFAMIVRA